MALRASTVKKTLCIYCGKNPGITQDHIPPRCFFEEPCPNISRITVPCCEKCKLGGRGERREGRNLLISTMQAEPHRVVESQLADARNRGLEHYGQLPVMLAHMVRVTHLLDRLKQNQAIKQWEEE